MWRASLDEESRIDRLFETIRLGALRSHLAGSLSHGQKPWLEIGMLLAQEPKLPLVEEHDMTFVRELGVKVTVLHEGTVIAEGSIDQVSENERVIEVYLGR